jgi:hypothetical protein
VTPIRAIRQAWARASFATVIPVAAFLMGALLSILFTAYYFGSAYETFKVDTKAQKEQLARALAGDLADNDIVEIQLKCCILLIFISNPAVLCLLAGASADYKLVACTETSVD